MEVKIKGIYKHYKGDYYIVDDIATNSETLEKMVIYRGLYENSPLWVRPYDLFISKSDSGTGIAKESKYRFELQDIKSNNKDL